MSASRYPAEPPTGAADGLQAAAAQYRIALASYSRYLKSTAPPQGRRLKRL